jgi:5-methylcytosine-specific restriction endonuclease McrA
VTDHIQPVKTHPELFWEPSNHRSLCHACNRRSAETPLPSTRPEPSDGDEGPALA